MWNEAAIRSRLDLWSSGWFDVGGLFSCYQPELVPKQPADSKVLLLAPLQPCKIHCRVLNQVSWEHATKPTTMQVQTSFMSGSTAPSWELSLAHEQGWRNPLSFHCLPHHPTVTRANIIAVLFEAALINSCPWYIMMVKQIELKNSQAAARHQLTKNWEKTGDLTLTALLNVTEVANWAYISHLLHKTSFHPFPLSSAEL